MPSISPVPSSTVNGTIRSVQATVHIERLIPDRPLLSPAPFRIHDQLFNRNGESGRRCSIMFHVAVTSAR
jgi:hypothetical protein